jgi:7,8-dihydroneopterin aldolase/epimerase/oxygenase
MIAADAGRFRLLPTEDVDDAPAARHHAPMDVVFIEGFVGETVIGICADELHQTQPVRIDLAAGIPRSFACTTDRLTDTIDYGSVREALIGLLCEHRHRLLEALAESIAQLVLGRFRAHWVRVAVAKPAKFADVDAVGVVIERRRAGIPEQRAHVGERSMLAHLGAGMFPRADG